MTRGGAVAGLLLTLTLAACGGSEQEAEPRPAPRETVDALPKLPDGWRPYVDRRAGFALALPRGWKPRRREDGALIRSFDRLVAISVVADRSAEGLAIPLGEYAARAARALPGFEDGLRRRRARSFRHRYRGAMVVARGTAAGGVEQQVSVIALRRDRVVTLTAVIAANARPAARASRRLAVRAVETLRSRPPRRDRGQRSGRSG